MEKAIMGDLMDSIFGNTKIEIRVGNRKRRETINEIILPTRAWMNDDRITVNVREIRSMRSKGGFDPVLILDMYDGRKIRISYTFSSNLRNDMEEIMKLRKRDDALNRISVNDIYIEF